MNYNGSGAAGTAGAGSILAVTAGGADILWIGLAAFALIAAGTALLRIIPRKEQ